MAKKIPIGERRLFFDGASGTQLQDMGLAAGELPETWNLIHPDRVKKLHRGYLEVGCDIFNTNTFGANRLKYPDQIKEIVTSAVSLADEARREANREDAWIALDVGPTGKLLEPMGDLPFEEAVSVFREVVELGAKAGADLVLIETMADLYEAKAAVLAAKEACDLPVMITLTFDETGKMLTGGTPEAAAAVLEGLHADAIGVNCGMGPLQMKPIVERLIAACSVPVIVNPNAGLPRSENGVTYFDIGPDEFAEAMKEISLLGAHGIGGCCGTTPEHIRKTIELCKDLPFHAPIKKNITAVTSFSKTVVIDRKPVIIGERINPTGKKKFKEALKAHDIDYILTEGLKQEDAGADILDVNVGLPDIDEPEMITEVIQSLQAITALPLQIDTSDVAAMERALRIYNGQPMINSVNGKAESMRAVFPLVKKYGGVVVALLLDEDGIPETAEKRIAIAKKIVSTAAEYGIEPKNIVLDALAMTVSSNQSSALVTLETLRRIRDELGMHSILGVSNISFGLPRRELVNGAFFTMAMQSGLSLAIINPNNAAMMNAYRSYLVLSGLDPQCTSFINAYAGTKAVEMVTSASAAPPSGSSAGNASDGDVAPASAIGQYIERGLDKKAASAAREALDGGTDPMALVNGELIPALDRVGKAFEKGTLFLPQLLMSAEAAKAAFEIVKGSIQEDTGSKKEKVILATVKGDIHDIGKNIVKVLLENYGYDVIDMGRDVPPEAILERAMADDVTLVGLSALMTTTVANMEDTIRLLKEKKPGTITVVGGAVMNPEYAAQIGADFYAKDAMSTVHVADRVFHHE
jgi:5-methyltetrahydrofolate--homocysteine methyltransferase